MTLDEYLALPFSEQVNIRLERRSRREGIPVDELRSRLLQSFEKTIEDEAHDLRDAIRVVEKYGPEHAIDVQKVTLVLGALAARLEERS